MSSKDSGQGALFENDRRTKDSHPNFRGELTLTKPLLKELVDMAKEGKEIKISLSVWNKVAKSGKAYMSIAAQAYVEYSKNEQQSRNDRPATPPPPPKGDFSDDDVPF
jgi:hypothetical protein